MYTSGSYCKWCMRDLPRDGTCTSCEALRRRMQPAVRIPLCIGVPGLLLLIIGMMTSNGLACVAGGVLAVFAAIVTAVLVLRAGAIAKP